MPTTIENPFTTTSRVVKRHHSPQVATDLIISNLMQVGEINFTVNENDSFIVGSAIPLSPLKLEPNTQLDSQYFLEKHELGIINIGANGTVVADGIAYQLGPKESLYIGSGTKEIIFHSETIDKPALFYFNAATTPTTYPTQKNANLVSAAEKSFDNELPDSNNQFLIGGTIQTHQLQMGITELEKADIWNREPYQEQKDTTEIYFYLDVPENQTVCHFTECDNQMNHIWIKNHQAVIASSKGVSSGFGTTSFSFIWGITTTNSLANSSETAKINVM